MSDENHESFEDRIRELARELGRSAERMAKVDIDEIAESIGVNPERARDWADTASRWLREQVEGFGGEFPPPFGGPWSRPTEGPWSVPEDTRDPRDTSETTPARNQPKPGEDPLRSAAPHPLDIPTDEQGGALAALDSGRWTVEPGSHMLTGRGEGTAPNDALGLVRELHSRDWIDSNGEVTLVGRRALTRWLELATR
jgi:hypothetical protein